ncbi:MAG: proton-conducting transporter membrane subunit [Desulfobacterales bacterium]|nr:proton-conducting transporter membrane subunit [Desulfobacterales bacterium]
MSFDAFLPLIIILSSLIPGIIIFMLPEARHGWRTLLNMLGASIKMLLIGVMIWGIFNGHVYETRLPLLPGLDLVLHADKMSVLIAALSAILWFVTTIYAIGYLEDSPQPRSRFFGFFSLCVSSTMGIALAGNLMTFLLFYEMLTISTYPLVVHRGTNKSMRAGQIYLAYTLSGGTVLLLAIAWLKSLVGPLDFTAGGMLAGFAQQYHHEFKIIFFLLIAGLGVKAALVPLHGWLPMAMIAPAPVSALLHAVAVVKAGAFGIVRVVYDVYGVELAQQLGLLNPLAYLASFTIIYGSVKALYQDELKKRLAYSTVSQVSYIALGAGLFGPIATIGGVVHLVHQGLMKITLFFCAGNLAETLGIHHVGEINGAGRRMPWTMAAFTIGAMGMIGIPPMAGFISKWYLGTGALAAGQDWVILVLLSSSILNAGYFLPIIYRAWFKEPPDTWPAEHVFGRFETHWLLFIPPLITAFLALMVGLLADAPFSPLEWTRLIAAAEYSP